MLLYFSSSKGLTVCMSNPSRMKLSSCAPISITSALFCGHLNRSFSSLFCQRQNPFRSQYKTLRIVRPRLQNTKRWPENRSSRRLLSTRIDRLFIAFRMSVVPGARKTRILDGRKIISVPIHGLHAQGLRNQILCRFLFGSVGRRRDKAAYEPVILESTKIFEAALQQGRAANRQVLIFSSSSGSSTKRSCLSYSTLLGSDRTRSIELCAFPRTSASQIDSDCSSCLTSS